MLRLYNTSTETGMNTAKYKNKYRIESIRLKCWDYGANGCCFVTICVKNRECVLGCIEKGENGLIVY